ncbi:MAG: type II and III secretion system protein family protein [Acidobacteria bacterium]|nr:type II and III secretion system protein family protein [Acidobacteriota bacterium]
MNQQFRRDGLSVHPAQNYVLFTRLAGPLAGPLAGLLILVMALCLSISAQDKSTIPTSFANNGQPLKIDVLVGQSRLVEFDEEYERLSISDPKIAEVVPITPRQALVNGLTFGQVNLVAWAKHPKGAPDRMIVFDIFVQVNLSLIDNQIKILFPKENIQLSQANNSVVLSGSVTKPELADQVQKIIEAAGLKVTNLLKAPVLDAAQVQLQIRVAEVNRQVLRELATAYGIANNTLPAFISSGGPAILSRADLKYGPSPTSLLETTIGSTLNLFLGNPNSSAATLGFIRALNTRGAIRSLAEPNLIAMHGKKASFLAGGEFPIPVIQSINAGQSAITIIFKEFGVKLDFTPTIIDENHIRLDLTPEVSSLDFASGVQISGIIVPGLRVRRASTTLELRDGQSFALAGLIDNSERVNLSKIPLLGDIPILGELFKSRSFQRSETELLFLATVKIVEPLNPDQIPRLPGVSELKPIGSSSTGATPASSIEGQSGHSVPPRKPGEDMPEAENNNKKQAEPQQQQTAPAAQMVPAVPAVPAGVETVPVKVERASVKKEIGSEKAVTSNLTTEVVGPSGVDPGPARNSVATPAKDVAPKAQAKEKTPAKGPEKP